MGSDHDGKAGSQWDLEQGDLSHSYSPHSLKRENNLNQSLVSVWFMNLSFITLFLPLIQFNND